VTVPDLATLPFAGSIDPSESNAYHNFSSNYRKETLALASRSRGHIVTVVDGYDLFADFFSRPAAYGFVPNATNASCLAGAYGEVPRSLCTKPDEYVFWDAYHVRILATHAEIYSRQHQHQPSLHASRIGI
jgi:phospholipase/lecithinase/hemolysin